ncbi:uncharacterized protein LOC142559255 [Dermacentor variabilis]|uniref:uncharacterized protein LOC142559255 n=1 Tax=Dermacentor variabilis TaxID=34621 RepID=UPI003F5B4F21
MAEEMSTMTTTMSTAEAGSESFTDSFGEEYWSTEESYAKAFDINGPTLAGETEELLDARPRASRRRAFVPVTERPTSSSPSLSCADDDTDESDRCGDTGTATARTGTTSGASESNVSDVAEPTVVPSAEWLDEDEDAEPLRTEENLPPPTPARTTATDTPAPEDATASPNIGRQPKSELRTKDSAAKGSEAKDRVPKRAGKKAPLTKGPSTKGPSTKGPSTKGHRAKGSVAKSPRRKGHVTKRITKRGHKAVTGSTSQMPTAARPARISPALICAYGNWTNVDTAFPEDGLCDYAFFDALYRGRPREADVARLRRRSAALRRFLAGTRRYRRTQNGVAISYRGLRGATKDMESSHAASDMRTLWENGVRHLGVLDFVPGADATEASVERLFKFLQLCRKLQDKVIPKTAQPKPSLALGMTFLSSNQRQVYASVEKHLRSGWSPSRQKIDLVVLRTHLSGRDDGDPSCTVTGSSVWGRTLADYQPSMVDALNYLEKKLKPMSSESLFFVSMSAAARRYVPVGSGDNAKGFEPGSRCKAYDESDYAREIDSFASVCGDAEYAAHIARDEAHETMHSFRLSPRSAVTFDSEDTIFAKTQGVPFARRRS